MSNTPQDIPAPIRAFDILIAALEQDLKRHRESIAAEKRRAALEWEVM